jgi:23S rRNA A2030 N6-methylase RlmJ
MIIINPPWQLRESLAEVLPWLRQQLATEERAAYRLK